MFFTVFTLHADVSSRLVEKKVSDEHIESVFVDKVDSGAETEDESADSNRVRQNQQQSQRQKML